MSQVLDAPVPPGPTHDGAGPVPRRSPHRPLGTRVTGPARWVLAAAIFAAVMGTAFGLDGVIRDMRWLMQAAVVVAGTLLVPALLRRYPALGPFAPLGALAGWVMSLTLVFFPGGAILGIIPTTATVAKALELASDAATLITSNVAPVPSQESMHFLLSAGLGFAALLIDTLAITVALPAASPLALVLILLPGALTTSTGISGSAFVVAGAGYLLILGCARWYAPDGKLRTDTPKVASGVLGKAAALGAAVVLLMTLATQAMPGFTQGLYPQGAQLHGTGGAGSLDPMLSLGDDLRAQSGRVSLRYRTTATEAPYMRLTTLENFSGKIWEPTPLPDGLGSDLSNLVPAAGPSPSLARSVIETRISVPGAGDPWLPAPLAATSVEALPGVWLWNPSNETIKSERGTTAGQSYLVRSEMPVLTPALLNNATAAPRAGLDPVFSQLPRDVPDIVATTAAAVTGAAPTPYGKAMAIQDFLRSDEFSYSLSTPVVEGYDGSGMGVLADFLEQKSGYCVHFSAAMAVMAREVGIPSRIAVGYTSGTSDPTLDETGADGVAWRGHEVTGRDAHAWPELYFEGLGWVPFEPTPSRGYIPDYAQQDAAPAPAPEPNPTGANPGASTAATTAPATTAAGVSGAGADRINAAHLLAVTGWILLALFVLAIPAMLRWLVRQSRLTQVRTPGPGVSPAVVAWREVLSTAVDHGHVVDPALTPARQAAAIAGFLGTTEPPGLALVLASYEQSVYGGGLSASGPEELDALADGVEALLARFQSSAAPWRRLRATVAPASLLPRAKKPADTSSP